MPVVRNLVVVPATAAKRVFAVLKKRGDMDPVGIVEAPEATLFFLLGRVDAGWLLKKAKIPENHFRCLWIDDENGFARAGRYEDPCFNTRFVIAGTLLIRRADLKFLKSEYKKDKFVSLGQKHWAMDTPRNRKRATESASIGFAYFLANFKPESYRLKGWLWGRTYTPIKSSYNDPAVPKNPFLWLNFNCENLGCSAGDEKYKHKTSCGKFFAVDTNIWWASRREGTAVDLHGLDESDDDDLMAWVIAEFTFGKQNGFISDDNAQLNGGDAERNFPAPPP